MTEEKARKFIKLMYPNATPDQVEFIKGIYKVEDEE